MENAQRLEKTDNKEFYLCFFNFNNKQIIFISIVFNRLFYNSL